VATKRTDRRATADRDPGAYIGREPERATETIPGGVGRKDRRVAAIASQPGPRVADRDPAGHAEGPDADSDAKREAGQTR